MSVTFSEMGVTARFGVRKLRQGETPRYSSSAGNLG